jgi:predicted XRE-type DNA-binding protein
MSVIEGSGNVFADLGLPNPEERQAKAMVAIYIEQLIEQNGWTQGEAAERMGLSQPDVSNIVHGRLKGFTLDRLFLCLNALDQHVEINIRPAKNEKAHTLVACG